MNIVKLELRRETVLCNGCSAFLASLCQTSGLVRTGVVGIDLAKNTFQVTSRTVLLNRNVKRRSQLNTIRQLPKKQLLPGKLNKASLCITVYPECIITAVISGGFDTQLECLNHCCRLGLRQFITCSFEAYWFCNASDEVPAIRFSPWLYLRDIGVTVWIEAAENYRVITGRAPSCVRHQACVEPTVNNVANHRYRG